MIQGQGNKATETRGLPCQLINLKTQKLKSYVSDGFRGYSGL